MNQIQNNKTYQLAIVGFLVLVAFTIGRMTKQDVYIKPKVLREDGFTYIKPILLCNTDNQQKYNEDLQLSKSLSEYVQKTTNEISVYFLNLSNGEWASINENMTFSPASMLKVPTVVDSLKFAEKNPNTLNKKIYFDGSFDDNKAEYYKPSEYLLPNKYYAMSDLMKYTIENSDNNALKLLHENINPRSLQELYSDLKIEIPQNVIDFMNAKTYSLFLRVLYNSTYLSRESSENVIEMMIKSDFPIGIKSGVPKEIVVADKFGERQINTPSGEVTKRELHDCGIVYAENKNYILCVMTSGKDFSSLAENISEISKLVFGHVSRE